MTPRAMEFLSNHSTNNSETSSSSTEDDVVEVRPRLRKTLSFRMPSSSSSSSSNNNNYPRPGMFRSGSRKSLTRSDHKGDPGQQQRSPRRLVVEGNSSSSSNNSNNSNNRRTLLLRRTLSSCNLLTPRKPTMIRQQDDDNSHASNSHNHNNNHNHNHSNVQKVTLMHAGDKVLLQNFESFHDAIMLVEEATLSAAAEPLQEEEEVEDVSQQQPQQQRPLSRHTKDLIAKVVTYKTEAPSCQAATKVLRSIHILGDNHNHTDPSTESSSSSSTEDVSVILKYAEQLVAASLYHHDLDEPPSIHASTRIEVALVVLLQLHMYRCRVALPKTDGHAGVSSLSPKHRHNNNSHSHNKLLAKCFAPFAISSSLQETNHAKDALALSSSSPQVRLPPHLSRARHSTAHQRRALGNIVAALDRVYDRHLAATVVPSTLLGRLDQLRPDMTENTNASTNTSTNASTKACWLPHQVVHWITSRRTVLRVLSSLEQAILMVALYVTYAPKCVHNSNEWIKVQQALGPEVSQLLVVWCSLRATLDRAQGLDENANGRTELELN